MQHSIKYPLFKRHSYCGVSENYLKCNAFMCHTIIVIIARTPSRYPPHQSVYSVFCKWRDNGILEKVFRSLKVDTDLENLSIDSTSARAYL